MNSSEWADLLVKALIQLLMAYVSRQGQDAGQDVLSRVSYHLANFDASDHKLLDPAKIRWPLLPTQVERDAAGVCMTAVCSGKPSHLNGVKVR